MILSIYGQLARNNKALFDLLEEEMREALQAEFGDTTPEGEPVFYYWCAFEPGLEYYALSSEGDFFSLRSGVSKLTSGEYVNFTSPDGSRKRIRSSWVVARATIDVDASPDTHTIEFADGDPSNHSWQNLILRDVEDEGISSEDLSTAFEMKEGGSTYEQIANALDVPKTTIWRAMKARSS